MRLHVAAVLALAPRVLWAQAAIDPNEHGHGHVHPHPHENGDHHHHPHVHPHNPGQGHHHPADLSTPPPAPPTPQPVAPTLGGFTPAEGPPGIEVTLTGTGFDQSASVWFNGRSLKLLRVSSTQIVVLIPANAQSDVFQVRQSMAPAQGGPRTKEQKITLQSASPFVVVRPPRITGFAPPLAPPESRVEVYGGGFRAGDQVLFASQVLKVVEQAPHRLVVLSPVGPARAPIIVQRGNVSVASKQLFTALPPAPVIVSFEPTMGGPGQIVRIKGQNFIATDMVRLAGRPQKVIGRGPEFIEFQVEAGPQARTGLIEVFGRNRRVVSAANFEVLRPAQLVQFMPRLGPPGTHVQLTGKNFTSLDQVLLGDKVLKVIGLSPAKVEVEIPQGAQTGSFVLRRGDKQIMSKQTFEVLYPPIVKSFEPTSGPVNTLVLIRGEHLTPDARILLGNAPLRVMRRGQGNEEVGVMIPPSANTSRFVVVTRGGQTTSTLAFQVTEPATISGFSPTFGPAGTKVTINGQRFPDKPKVLLGDVVSRVLTATPAELVVVVPEGAKPAPFQVETFGKLVASKSVFRVIAPPPPRSLVMSPMYGAAGSEVLISIGRPFQAADQILFEGQLLPKRVLPGAMQARVRVPADAKTGFFEVIISAGTEKVRGDRPFEVTGTGRSTGPQPGIY